MQNTTHLGCPNRFTYVENTIGNLQKALTAKFLGSDRLNRFGSLAASRTFLAILAIITSLSKLYVRSWKFRLRFRRFPRDIKILGWCPAGPVLPYGEKVLTGRRCLFILGWPPFYWWCYKKNTLWGRYFTKPTSLFLLGWLKLNLTLLD